MAITTHHKPPYLHQLIAALTLNERRAAADWLASPYHQQRADFPAPQAQDELPPAKLPQYRAVDAAVDRLDPYGQGGAATLKS